MSAGRVAEDDGAGAGACPNGFDGDTDLAQDGAEADGGAEIVGGNRETDTVGQQRRGETGEPALVQRLPVAAVQEDGDGGTRRGLEQVHDLARTVAVGDFQRRMRRAGSLGGLAPALHHGRVVGHEGAIVVLGFEVQGLRLRLEARKFGRGSRRWWLVRRRTKP